MTDPKCETLHHSPPAWVSILAGGSAGTCVDVALFPIDTLKTRMQSSQGFIKAGGFTKIYSGLGPAVLGSAPTAAIFFLTYESIKQLLLPQNEISRAKYLPGVTMLAASLGEVAACLIRVPVEVVKQRRQAYSNLKSMDIVTETWRTEGIRGMYRGYTSTVIREVPFSILQFPLWEVFKNLLETRKNCDPCTPFESAVCGAISGGFSAAITNPLDVAKTRIMLAPKDSPLQKDQRIFRVLEQIYRLEGVRSLFAGTVPRVIFISIGGIVFFGSFEYTKQFALKLYWV